MRLAIGPVQLEMPVILAPMSGVSDLPFRRMVKRFGSGMAVTEMIASKAMIHASRKSFRMADAAEDERPVAVQLAGCEPEVMAEAARLVRDRGAEIVDINMGCPVKKVVKGDAGSALMRDEGLAARIMAAVVDAVDVPVTLKMRTGWDDRSRNAPQLARIAEESGIQAITVHGRTRCQFFAGRADWAFIGSVKESVSIPVIGNGDVTSPDDARRLLEESGADGVMVGRGAYGRPWLVRQVAHFLATGERLPDPPLDEQLKTVLDHYEAMLSHRGVDAGLRAARKHVAWYTRGLPGSAAFRARIMQLTDPEKVVSAIRGFYEPLCQRVAA